MKLLHYPFVMFLTTTLFGVNLSSCKEDCYDMRPDLQIPEVITPELVRQYLNPNDFTGTYYRNEFYHSVKWMNNGPYPIPAYEMFPFLPFVISLYPYYDPYGRFVVSGLDPFNNYMVTFSSGLWNQGGYIFYGQYNWGITIGDTLTVYKYMFNTQTTSYDNGLFHKACESKPVTASKIRIRVTKDNRAQPTEEKKHVEPMSPNSYSLVITNVRVTESGFYTISATADIDNDIAEKDENNNDEPKKNPIKWGKHESALGIWVQ